MAVNRTGSFLEQLIYKQVLFQFCIYSCTILKKPKVCSFGLGDLWHSFVVVKFFIYSFIHWIKSCFAIAKSPHCLFSWTSIIKTRNPNYIWGRICSTWNIVLAGNSVDTENKLIRNRMGLYFMWLIWSWLYLKRNEKMISLLETCQTML